MANLYPIISLCKIYLLIYIWTFAYIDSYSHTLPVMLKVAIPYIKANTDFCQSFYILPILIFIEKSLFFFITNSAEAFKLPFHVFCSHLLGQPYCFFFPSLLICKISLSIWIFTVIFCKYFFLFYFQLAMSFFCFCLFCFASISFSL